MKKYINVKSVAIVVGITIFLFAIVPCIIEYGVFRNHFISVIENKDWASLLGSYIGGIFGGFATLLAVLISIKKTEQVQKDTIDRQEQVDKREKIKDALAIMPIFDFGCSNEEYELGDFNEITSRSEENKINYECRFKIPIKNVGKSIAQITEYEITLDMFVKEKNVGRYSEKYNEHIIINSGESKLIEISSRVAIDTETKYLTRSDINALDIMMVIFYYEDIFKNKYKQLFTVLGTTKEGSVIKKKNIVQKHSICMPEIYELSKIENIKLS